MSWRSEMVLKLPAGLRRLVQRVWYHRALRKVAAVHEPEYDVVRLLIDAGDSVVDIGANLGVYTRVMAGLVGPTGRVLAVEPVPSTFALLTRHVEMLRARNVVALNVALSDRAGEIEMSLPLRAPGGGIYRAEVVVPGSAPASADHELVATRATTLDDITADIAARISFVKCDVEGHELRLLKGGQRFLGESNASWLLEVSGNPDVPGSSAADVMTILTNHGLRCYWYDGSRLHARRHGDESTNYFFLSEQHQKRLAGILDNS